jgi:PufQ cytochrome subunit
MAYDAHDQMASERRHRGITWEYRTYFVAILLLIALPMAVWQWTAGVFQPRGAAPNPGVAQRAMSEARIITTTIFSA